MLSKAERKSIGHAHACGTTLTATDVPRMLHDLEWMENTLVLIAKSPHNHWCDKHPGSPINGPCTCHVGVAKKGLGDG